MGVTVGDWLATGSNGAFQETVTVSAPAVPTITVADDESGTSLTVTIDGDAGATNYVRYRETASFTWLDGGSRSGDGTVQVTGLAKGSRYIVQVISQSAAGVYSLPSDPSTVRVTDGSPQEILAAIGDAVVAELNAGAWSQAFTASRSYVIESILKDLKTLHVDVVAHGITSESKTRGKREREDYLIDIGIRKRYTAETNVQIDPLMALVKEIRDSFKYRRLENYPSATCIHVPRELVYEPAHMLENRQFTSVVTLTFRVIR